MNMNRPKRAGMKRLVRIVLAGVGLSLMTGVVEGDTASAQSAGAGSMRPTSAAGEQSGRAEKLRRQNRLRIEKQTILRQSRQERLQLERFRRREIQRQRARQFRADRRNAPLARHRGTVRRHQSAVRYRQRQQQLRFDKQRRLNRLRR